MMGLLESGTLHDCLLYLRLIIYPLGALGIIVVALPMYQNTGNRLVMYAMVSTACLLIALLAVESTLLVNMGAMGFLSSVCLTPAVLAVVVFTWAYAISKARARQKEEKEQAIKNGHHLSIM